MEASELVKVLLYLLERGDYEHENHSEYMININYFTYYLVTKSSQSPLLHKNKKSTYSMYINEK